MNKLVKSLGATLFVSFPLATVISCSSAKQKEVPIKRDDPTEPKGIESVIPKKSISSKLVRKKKLSIETLKEEYGIKTTFNIDINEIKTILKEIQETCKKKTLFYKIQNKLPFTKEVMDNLKKEILDEFNGSSNNARWNMDGTVETKVPDTSKVTLDFDYTYQLVKNDDNISNTFYIVDIDEVHFSSLTKKGEKLVARDLWGNSFIRALWSDIEVTKNTARYFLDGEKVDRKIIKMNKKWWDQVNELNKNFSENIKNLATLITWNKFANNFSKQNMQEFIRHDLEMNVTDFTPVKFRKKHAFSLTNKITDITA